MKKIDKITRRINFLKFTKQNPHKQGRVEGRF